MSDQSMHGGRLSRRGFLCASGAGVAALSLSACTTVDFSSPALLPTPEHPVEPGFGNPALMYAAQVDEGHKVPAVPFDRLDPKFLRQVVADPTGEKPGTIVVDTTQHFLYLVQPGGKAIRYGVSLGKAGFGWTGSAVVQWKKRWPVWTPPPEMIERRPELEKYNEGMPPGPQNPLGARALYLFRDGRDTMYRLHGTPEWDSIGKNASSGCVRFINQDIMDLYSRVNGVAQVHVRGAAAAPLMADAGAFGQSRTRTAERIDAGVPRGAELLR